MTSTGFLAPISALPSLEPSADAADQIHALRSKMAGERAATTTGSSFTELVSQGLEQVNAGLMASQRDMQSLAAGGTENLHQLMIRLEESRLSFQLLVQVRNRVLESYQELMRMQV